MNIRHIYARMGISARTRIIFNSVLFFLTGLIIFTQLSIFEQPASAISFTTNSAQPADVLDYKALGYTYDSLQRQDSDPSLKVRKNAASLTSNEINKFVNAVKALKNQMTTGSNGTRISIYDQFVATHLGAFDVAGRLAPDGNTFVNPGHTGAAFLPWHREFLYQFEQILQVVDPSVTVPYWDFTDRSSTQNIIFQDKFMGPNGNAAAGSVVQSGFFSAANGWLQRKDLSGKTWTGISDGTQPIARKFRGFENLPTTAQVDDTLSKTTYKDFSSSLERVTHNSSHLWVGGSVANVATSPNDPIFWMLHANVDRIWAQWQQDGHWGNAWYPASGQRYGHNLNDVMWPWDRGQMSAAADLQALIPGQPLNQITTGPIRPSTRFRVASSPEDLISDRTSHLYNPFSSIEDRNIAHHMSDEVATGHNSNSSSWTS